MTPAFSYAKIYVCFAGVIALTMFLLYPRLNLHEWQYFLRGMTYSTLYQNNTLPTNMIRFIDQAEQPFQNSLLQDTGSILELDVHDRTPYIPLRNVRCYPFVNFMPHIISGTLGDIFDLKPATIFYLTRGIFLLSGIIFGYFILLSLPAYHLPVMVALLLPSEWLIYVQQFPDSTANIAAFLYFTLLVRVLYYRSFMNWHKILIFIIVGSILSASKTIYFPLTFSVLLIPAKSFGGTWRRLLCISVLILSCTLSSLTNVIYIFNDKNEMAAYATHRIIHNENMARSITEWETRPTLKSALEGELGRPFNVMNNIYVTYTNPNFWEERIYGLFLCSMLFIRDIQPSGIYLLLLGLIPLLISNRHNVPPEIVAQPPRYDITLNSRMIIAGLIIVTAILIAVAMNSALIARNSMIPGILGRYYIPLLPYLAFCFSFQYPKRYYITFIIIQGILAYTVLTVLYVGLINTGFYFYEGKWF